MEIHSRKRRSSWNSSFRNLTIQSYLARARASWSDLRGTSEPTSSPSKSTSFLQKAKELSERARLAAQDDSALFSESKSATTFRMKPRQRRIESFHGRRASSGHSSSAATPTTSSKVGSAAAQSSSAADTDTSSKSVLKEWATENDLSSSRKPVIMSGSHVSVPSSRHMPLTTTGTPSGLNQEEATPRGYTPKSPPVLGIAKSTPDIADRNYETVASPTSPKSPSWYQQKYPNRSMVFEFSAPPPKRTSGSPRNSYVGGSPRNSYSGVSPRNSYAGASPRNSYASVNSRNSYSPVYSQNYPTSSVSGFSPMSVPTSMILNNSSMTDSYTQRSSANYLQNQKLVGANTNSYDDTPSKPVNKNYDRRSLPPQSLAQFRQEMQKESSTNIAVKTDVQKPLASMPVTQEEEELDKEIPDIKPLPPNDLDIRPMYSPPAPPVRDISSLKYVSYGRSHEKYPSWPVATAQSPQNLGPPLEAQTGEKCEEKGSDSDKSEQSCGDKSEQTSGVQKSRNSPSVDRKGCDEGKQYRNQSDPGFKQKPKKTFYTTRKPPAPKEPPDPENVKSEEERFRDFCKQSKPGYPPPKFDPDGHNYGDEKYSIPSPPERDVPLDERSLVQKIAAVISPSPHPFNQTYNFSSSESNKSHASASGSKMQGTYFHQALNSNNHLRSSLSHNKSTVDSGTSPLNSPNEDQKKFGFKTVTANVKADSMISPSDKSRGLIIRQMPYYNTSTQTDDSLNSQLKNDKTDIDMTNYTVSNQMSQSSVSSVSPFQRSESSSQSSGIGSMSFTDHSSAPMLRKLSEEFYRGTLSSVAPSEKRMSSASAYDEMKSPRSDSSHFGGMKEAESYSSVVIHPQEHSGPFGGDDLGSSPSLTTSHQDVSDAEYDPYRSRRSIDSALFLHKPGGSMSIQVRSLQEGRFTSESNLSVGSHNSHGNHSYSQSLLHLNRPSPELSQHRSDSSSSRPRGSMEARSSGSGSRIGSDSSASGTVTQRHDSDSVFYDRSSPVPTKNSNIPTDCRSSSLGRKESMKMAYGTFEDYEPQYATPYGHQRNSSEILSTSGIDPHSAHGRSQSFNDYMPMHFNQQSVDNSKLGQIQEEGSEIRWQEAVKKSRSLSRDGGGSDYANDIVNEGVMKVKETESDRRKGGKTGMRRTVSENYRPKKHREQNNTEKSGSASSSGESQKGNKSDSENSVKMSHQHRSDSNLIAQRAVLEFVERKKKESDISSEPHSPEARELPYVTSSSGSTAQAQQPPKSPLEDIITKKYNYTKAQRAESLRRTQSISSNSSRDSVHDYMDMRRIDRNYQTEWSRLRSQDGVMPRRPLSIGSDLGGAEVLGPSPSSQRTTPQAETFHSGSDSDTALKKVTGMVDSTGPAPGPPPSKNDKMVTSPVYQNYETDFPRRPPPPVPGSREDNPPALPPRSQRLLNNSKSESFLFSNLDSQQRDDLKTDYLQTNSPAKFENGTLRKDAYAEQLRRQARRLSEQAKPMSMQIVSTRPNMPLLMSQSYKQEPTQALEAVPLAASSTVSSPVLGDKMSVSSHSPAGRATPDPPPIPTPMKNGEVEIDSELNKTADFPPPPAEFMEDETVDNATRCADDSYGSYRAQAAPREIGKYKRAVSDSKVLNVQPSSQQPELVGKDISETPNKPPRRKLGRDSPTQIKKSSSPNMPGTSVQTGHQSAFLHGSEYPEVTSTQHKPKPVVNPLLGSSVQNLTSSSGQQAHLPGGIVSTHVQRPSPEEPRPSVKDRIKNIEVISHSPSSDKSVPQRPGAIAGSEKHSVDNKKTADSLEQLESSVTSSHSFRDRLRPVVRKVELDQTEKYSHKLLPQDRLKPDVVDKVESTPPPQLPNRTYRHLDTSAVDHHPRPLAKPSSTSDSPYRRNSFQSRMYPQPYENKSLSSVSLSTSLSTNTPPYKQGTSQEHKKSPNQSAPEPQVPSKSIIRRQGFDSPSDHKVQQSRPDSVSSSENIPKDSDKGAAQNQDNVCSQTIHAGQKRSYDNIYSKSRNTSKSQRADGDNSRHNGSLHSGRERRNSENSKNSVIIYSKYEQRDDEKVSVDSPSTASNSNQSGDKNSRTELDSRKSDLINTSIIEPNNQTSRNVQAVGEQPSLTGEASGMSVTKLDQVAGNHCRQPSAEELECDQKAHELACVLPDSDKALSEVLSDNNKTRMQYMDGLFPAPDSKDTEKKRPRSASVREEKLENATPKEPEPTSPMPSNYYVSPPKAMIELEIRKIDPRQLTQEIGDTDTLAQKKEELLQRMVKKVTILKDDKKELLSDIEENERLGQQVLQVVEVKCRSQQESDKYRSYIEDMDKIIKLLLKLSGLLARAENTIQGLTHNTNEKIKKMTYDKRDRLQVQHENAKELKVDIDRRREQVETFLNEVLSVTEMDDYRHYIKMKSKHTIQLQELEDKITLGNEQIGALQKSIPAQK